jgi:tryptophan synthase alpha chain
MSRIARQFKQLKEEGRKGFVPFVTAGDPDLETCQSILKVLADSGADVIELGVPFSDPMADGPTIQASSQRALQNGTRLSNVLELVREFRSCSEIPIVLFSYLNPLLQYGVDKLVADASDAGVDGILVTDAIDEEAAEISDSLQRRNLDLISLVAPTTSDSRLEKVCSRATGFLYAVSRAGVTGIQNNVSSDAEALVSRVRQFTDLPVAVGFGISTPEQIQEVWQYADAAVVGSAIVAEISRSGNPDEVVTRVREFVDRLVPTVAKSPVEI